MAGRESAPGGDESASAMSTHSLEGGYTLKLATDKVIGNGSFGVVFEAKVVETGETVAIKKVLQDKRFKNRELQIMKTLDHPNIVKLKHYFYQSQEKKKEDGTAEEETYLNLVLEFIPDTVYKITRYYTKNRQLPPMLVVKLYVYQMLRSLAYLHSCGVCHRDIKPQNLLVDSRSHVLKLCDFGSAKALLPGEPSVAYICSRYYRAPELIFGSTEYTCAIDVWSAGCVAAELLLGHPLFPGDTGVDQLVEIIKVLGTPSREEVEAMNKAYTEFKFPQIRPYPWSKIFRPRAPPEAIDLISKLLQYVPTARLTAIEACGHEFFDEIRDPTAKLDPSIKLPPNLFTFTDKELEGCSVELIEKLIPPHVRPPNWAPPVRAARSNASSSSSSAAALAPGSVQKPPAVRVPDSGAAATPSAAAAAEAVTSPYHMHITAQEGDGTVHIAQGAEQPRSAATAAAAATPGKGAGAGGAPAPASRPTLQHFNTAAPSDVKSPSQGR